MSQEKVDKHKEQKANRKSINRKKKIKTYLAYAASLIVCAIIVGWIGFSIYSKSNESQNSTGSGNIPVNISAISDYLNGLTESE